MANAYGVGSIRIGDRLSLYNVLHIPDLNNNLLSVDKLLPQNYDVLFSGDGFMVRLGEKDVIKVVRVENLFRINGKARKEQILYSRSLYHLVGLTLLLADSPHKQIPSPPL